MHLLGGYDDDTINIIFLFSDKHMCIDKRSHFADCNNWRYFRRDHRKPHRTGTRYRLSLITHITLSASKYIIFFFFLLRTMQFKTIGICIFFCSKKHKNVINRTSDARARYKIFRVPSIKFPRL